MFPGEMMKTLLQNLALWTAIVLILCALFASLGLININPFGVTIPSLLMFLLGAVLCVLSVILFKNNDSDSGGMSPRSRADIDRQKWEVNSILRKSSQVGFSIYGALFISIALIRGNIEVGVVGIVASFSLFSNYFLVVFNKNKHFRKHYSLLYLCFLGAPIVDEFNGDTSFGLIATFFSPIALIHVSYEWAKAYKKLLQGTET
jgi:hypothetical protein